MKNDCQKYRSEGYVVRCFNCFEEYETEDITEFYCPMCKKAIKGER